MIVITGGAGFIGSNLVAALEERREPDLVVCDRLGRGDKWRNIAKRELAHIIPPEQLLDFLDTHARDINAVFHMGAISSTTEPDADAIVATNVALSLSLWDWCARHGARLIYASSAATYGATESDFDDDESAAALARLRPLNAYGWSKHVFDRRVARLVERSAARPPQWIGCKFFNVYGPNEYHKGDMRSVVTQFFPLAQADKPAPLFRSYRPDVPDGGQKRDFVYVRDCVDVMLWCYDHPDVNGLFNIGSGQARSFADVVAALYRAAGREPRSEFVPMPTAIQGRYQYFTQARLDKLRAAGYTRRTTSLEDGIADFVQAHLAMAGYLVGTSATHHYIFDLKRDEDVYWCAADIGWITGHSYIVYGPLCNGATSVLYEGTPDFPDKGRWWSIVERYGVTILYTAPTAIRSHMKWGPEYAERHDLSSLRLLGSVGEPINPEAWIWYREHIGGDRTPIVDTWWQTETGMILITPLPGTTTLKPGSATQPFPGVAAAVYDEQGNEVGPGGGGYLVLERPWPAMLRGIFGDDQRYRDTYWSKYEDVYLAGDGARIDHDGDYWLLGRIDDVMNVSGHRISTIEVESALVDHQEVAEAAVCSRADPVTGEAVVAYVTLKGGAEGSVEKLEELRNHVAQKIGPIAKPANIVFTPELPKTRSGKIMRRLLRDVANQRQLGDTTTLADPAVVDEIAKRATAEKAQEAEA